MNLTKLTAKSSRAIKESEALSSGTNSKILVITALCVLIFICSAFAKEYLFDKAAILVRAKLVQLLEPARASGTFIQTWMVKNWTSDMWKEEFDSLQEAGMEYIVLTPSLFYDRNEITGETVVKSAYPSEMQSVTLLAGSSGAQCPDIVEKCLENASQRNMKVFLGLNFSDDWWRKRNDEEWIYSMMHDGNRVAKELWDKYHDRYKDTFYGWYWSWEVDNFYSCTLDIFKRKQKILAKAIKIHTDYFVNEGMRLPIMLSPYVNQRLGTSERFADMWEYIFKNSGLKEGDVFCPQDSVGTGGMSIGSIGKWFSAYGRAVGAVPGIRLWSDVEAFDDSDWTPATLDRVVLQMNAAQPYVSNMILFSYTHYYSPNSNQTGFHDTYMDYLENGRLESVPPGVPEGFDAWCEMNQDGEYDVLLTWDEPQDNIGVCGYKIFRNGGFIAKKQEHISGNEPKEDCLLINRFRDTEVKPGRTYTYSVQAYDFAGNLSGISSEVVIAVPK
jgi:hypothetical protein